MVVLGKLVLHAFATEYSDSRLPLEMWQLEAEEAQWGGPEDVSAQYSDAVLTPEGIQFNIANVYQLDVQARYERGVLLVQKVWPVAKKRRLLAKAMH